MSYLLDTNIVSEFVKQVPEPKIIKWLQNHADDQLYLSVITIGEIQQGIARLPRSKRRYQLDTWLQNKLLIDYADFILPLETNTLLRWGLLTGDLMQQGRKLPVMDGLLAATALTHDLALVTRNERDFDGTGLVAINPWA